MFFLMRIAFWLGIACALLPTGAANAPTGSTKDDIDVVEAFSAATATVSDMRRFCERQPEACAVGSQAAVTFGHRAQAGAKMVFEFINERLSARETESRNTPGAPPKPAAARTSRHTLSGKDVVAPWRGPAAPRGPVVGHNPA